MLPLEHLLGEERILLEGIDAVRQSIGKGGVSFPGFGRLGGSFEGSSGDWCWRGGKRGGERGGELDVKGFGALGEGGEENCDVGQRGRATDSEVEGEGDAEEESNEAGDVDRGAHRCACGFKMDVIEERERHHDTVRHRVTEAI